jgi:hypothetical protein
MTILRGSPGAPTAEAIPQCDRLPSASLNKGWQKDHYRLFSAGFWYGIVVKVIVKRIKLTH